MRRVRKGFTLIELLIVIIIMGVLGAGLLLSSGQAVGAAKAATIVTNISQIKNGAMIYYTDHINSSDADICYYLRGAIRRYVDLAKFNGENENIQFDMTDHGTRKEWTADCDFTNDPDRDDIKAKLLNNKDFYFIEDYLFQTKVFFKGDELDFNQGNTRIGSNLRNGYGDSALRGTRTRVPSYGGSVGTSNTRSSSRENYTVNQGYQNYNYTSYDLTSYDSNLIRR